MGNLKQALESAVRIQRTRLATYEVREDFPFLRLNKSIRANQIIATFLSIPIKQRMAVALACVAAADGAAEGEHERLLKRAFHLRMSKRAIEELEAMALEPTPLDLDLDEDRFRQLEGGDLLSALIRKSDESLEGWNQEMFPVAL
jgi:hypothetical protein